MFPRFSAAFFLMVSALHGADFSGIWTGQMPDRNGDLEDFSFRFTQNGGALSGKMYGLNESTPITEGSVTGDRLTFLVTTELNGQITKTRFLGTSENGELHFTRERVDAKPNADKKASQQQLILKRLA